MQGTADGTVVDVGHRWKASSGCGDATWIVLLKGLSLWDSGTGSDSRICGVG